MIVYNVLRLWDNAFYTQTVNEKKKLNKMIILSLKNTNIAKKKKKKSDKNFNLWSSD